MFMLSENFFYFPSILRECVTNGAQGLLPPSKTAYTDSLLYSNQSITKPPISNETNLNVVPVSVSSFKSISNVKIFFIFIQIFSLNFFVNKNIYRRVASQF